MGIFDKMFGSKADRAEKSAEKTVQKADTRAADSDRINEATIKKESAELASKAQSELDFKRAVMRAKGSLMTLEQRERAALMVAMNDLQAEESKGEYSNPMDVAILRCNMKNIFYRLVTIKRNQKSLEQAEKNHRWKESMNDLSNCYKLINIVNGYDDGFIKDKVKLLVFRYRRKKVEKIDDMPYKQLKKYFGKNAETEISDKFLEELSHMDTVDMMVDDVLFDKLTDAAQIDKCLIDPSINRIFPDEMAHEIRKFNMEAASAGDVPPVGEFKDDREYSFEDNEALEAMLRSSGI